MRVYQDIAMKMSLEDFNSLMMENLYLVFEPEKNHNEKKGMLLSLCVCVSAGHGHGIHEEEDQQNHTSLGAMKMDQLMALEPWGLWL